MDYPSVFLHVRQGTSCLPFREPLLDRDIPTDKIKINTHPGNNAFPVPRLEHNSLLRRATCSLAVAQLV